MRYSKQSIKHKITKKNQQYILENGKKETNEIEIANLFNDSCINFGSNRAILSK